MAKVYVDTSALAEWKTNMDTINEDCLTAIGDIESSLSNLNSSFKGDYATKYEESFKEFIKKVKESHEAMRDFEKFLDTIVNIMENH